MAVRTVEFRTGQRSSLWGHIDNHGLCRHPCSSFDEPYLLRCMSLLLAHILRSRRCSDLVCFLRVFCRVDNGGDRRTLDPQATSRTSANCVAAIALVPAVTKRTWGGAGCDLDLVSASWRTDPAFSRHLKTTACQAVDYQFVSIRIIYSCPLFCRMLREPRG